MTHEKALKMVHDKLRGGSAKASIKDVIIKGTGELIDVYDFDGNYEGQFVDEDIAIQEIEVTIYSKDGEEVLTMSAGGDDKPFSTEQEALEVAQMLIDNPEQYLKAGNV